MSLHREPRIADPDAFYQALMDAHRGLDEEASRRLDARLVLILANQVGDMAVLRQALALAAQPRQDDMSSEGRSAP
ncbi:DUF2783 domain-containing protein [Roseococcus sp. DSY-14]|uniref:DUF2783 domain-containing protein n=1 Tax=Roseococcus sp. DSY-14 TaxID=3369650 RepID=UPI00387B0780